MMHMTRTHYEDITLSDMVSRSRLILTVSRQEPFQAEELVPIHKDTKLHPPYPKTKYNFKVNNILYDRYADGSVRIEGEMKVSTGSFVEAVQQDFETELYCHKLYYLEHRGKSPIFDRYETTADLFTEPELILFVSAIDGKELRYISYESMSRKEEVLKLIKGPEGKN
jgi:hypothetical protein